MKKISKILSLILAVSMLLTCISVPVFAENEKTEEKAAKTVEDYPEIAYALNVNDEKSLEKAKLVLDTDNTNENEFSGKWEFSKFTQLGLTEIKDIAAYETIEFYMCGDEKHPATLIFTIWANNPDTDGSDYYDGGEFVVKPGWNKYSFSISELKNNQKRSPAPLNQISSISIWADGWGLGEKNDLQNTVLYVDSVKLIRGDKLLLDEITVETETEAGTAKYFEYDFQQADKSQISGISFISKTNKIELASEKERKYLSIEGTSSDADCFIDIPVKYAGRYLVISGDFMVKDLTAGVQLITLKDATGSQNQLIRIMNNTLMASNNTQLRSVKDSEWINVAVCLDMANYVFDIYVNGELAKEKNLMDNKDFGKVSLVRVFHSPGLGSVNIDNFKMFDGKTPEDYQKATDKPAAAPSGGSIDVNTTVVPEYVQAKANKVKEVRDAVCLKVNSPFALVRHQQKAIDEKNHEVAPFVINGRTLVPVRFIAEAFGAEVLWNDATRCVTVKKDSDTLTLSIGSNKLNKNGTDIEIDACAEIYNNRTMLPLRAVTENLGKKVFWDDCGLIIISDNEINFTREKDLDKMLDIMAGFIYERPGQEKIKADILNKAASHPRLLATGEDFARIKSLAATDENIQKWVSYIIGLADKYVQAAPAQETPVYSADEGGRLANGYKIGEKASTMGMAYQLTGDKKYIDAMWITLEPMCKWEHWHPGHFLNAADLMWGVAMAYDWMYDGWSAEQKAIIEEGLYDCGIEDSITAYHGATDYLAPPMGTFQRSGWWKSGNNWNAYCNSGIIATGIVMATHEKYGDLAVKAIDYALNGVELGVRCYAPDGGYEEGPHYWSYGTDMLVMLMAALEAATGSDYGLADSAGLSVTWSNPLYSESKIATFNYSDAYANQRSESSSLFWFGRKYKNPDINRLRLNELTGGEKTVTYKDIIWYDPENISTEAKLTLDNNLLDTVTMRSSWTDENQVFTGIHAGSNTANHCNLDSGTFILDALGERWFTDFGRDNHNIPNYWASGTGGLRWQYYSQRAEGHNVYVINPDEKEDQIVQSVSPVTEYVSKPRGAYAKVDLTAAYAKNVNYAKRGLLFTANRKAVVIQDEIEMKQPSEFYWFAHTPADIELAADGRSAVLKIEEKKLHCQIVSDNPDLKFTVMDSVSLPTSPTPPFSATQKENSRVGTRKLVIYSGGISKADLAVVFVPMVGTDKPEYVYNYTPLSGWSVPDGEILTPTLTDIKVAGNNVNGFNANKTEYRVILPFGTSAVPEVTAEADNLSEAVVTLPASLPGTATIKVLNKEDLSMYSVYNVFMRVAEDVELEASDAQIGNGPENCLDKNLETRWAVEGEAWGIFHFANPKTISSVWIATWKAGQRKLIFDIEVSEDGTNFKQVFSGQSAANKDELEEFKIPEGTYKAVKLVLHGTTTGAWNSLLEVEFK